MKPLSFKTTSHHRLLLYFFLSLLWGITDSSTTVAGTTAPRTTAPQSTTTFSTILTTKPVAHVVSSLTAVRKYNFTRRTQNEGVASTGYTFEAVTAPENVKDLKVLTQNETSITLQWKRVDDILAYILVFNETEINVTATAGEVTRTISELTSATKYDFTLFTVLDNIRSSGVNYSAATAPENVKDLKVLTQNETSITLQWKRVDVILAYTLVFNEMEINVTATAGEVTRTISELTSATKYDFTLFTVLDNIKSSGVNYTAATAPENVKDLKVLTRNETSITLQWKRVDVILAYTLVFNETEINVTATAGEVTRTISELTSATKYDFTLFTVLDNIRSSGVNYTAATAPENVKDLKVLTQNETSITLQWKRVDDILAYTLVFNETEINVTATAGEVTRTISELTSATKYDFTLFTVLNNIRSSGVNYTAATAPENVKDLKVLTQNETSITLQWKRVDDILAYTLVFNETEINVTATAGEVTRTISELTSATKYDFTLFTVFDNIRSSGVNYSAATAPENVKDLKVLTQNETSITLQWKRVDDILAYTLVFNETEINVTATAGEVTRTISELTSATKYDFTLFTVLNNIRSSGVNYTAATAPENVKDLKVLTQNETSITLQWKRVDDILAYTLVFNETEINVTATAGEVTRTISELTSATKYDFTLFTVLNNIRSSGVNYTAATAPENVKDLKVLTQNETSITLQWKRVDVILAYILVFNETEINVTATAGEVTRTISELTSGTKYVFTLFALFKNIRSSGVNYSADTVPSMVASVKVLERSVTKVILEWENFDKGWSYILQMNGENVPLQPSDSTNLVSHSFKSLLPGTEYPFKVITVFSGLNSSAYENFTVTAIDCNSVNWHVTNSSIQGLVEGLFSNATATNSSQTHLSPGGSLVSFTGLYPGATYEVSLVYERNSMPFPQCSLKLTITPPVLIAHCEYWEAGYSVFIVWNKPAGVWTAVEVNVTGETYTVVDSEEQHFEISGFQPARTYEVSLASLSGTVRSYEPFVFSCPTDPRGVIAGSVFAVLLFGLMVCLVVFILLKRPDIIRKRKAFIGGSKLSSKKCKGISVAKFPDHFDQLNADENRGFGQEYESLVPVGTGQAQKEALLPENKPRNRFNNVLPYDWCRVKLTMSNPSSASDYINANYMPGYNSNKEYIATQGPLPSTVKDFWRMIWEQRVKGIVMVTNCIEDRRTKCEQYWPADSQPCLHGELLVTLISEQQEPNWTLRDLSVKHKNTSEERTVKHFHFTAWPDHGVPQCTEVLIQFRGLVRQHIERERDGAPTVVHCSAGVGRTGTLIALDVLLQQLEKERAVGINDFVHKMRLSRPHMVQTESQYVFLHQCVMDSLQPNEKTEENIYENADMIYANENADMIYANATALKEFHKNT